MDGAQHAADPSGERAAEHVLPLSLADSALAARVNDYLAPLAETGDFSGIVLIGRRDSILVLESTGMADYALGRPIGPETRFLLASVTKTITAGAILRLEAQGRLHRDDSLSRFLPDFPRADEITIRQLLLHRSGVGNPDYLPSYADAPVGPPMSLEVLVEQIARQPFQFDPGTAGSYSNAGYNLLARVVEIAAGMSWEEYLRGELFAPLGMGDSGEWSGGEAGPEFATGYLPGPPPENRIPAPPVDYGYSIGSGSLYSTAPDLWRWGRAMADEERFRWKDAEWPYGWGRVEVGAARGIEQTGAHTGFMSSLLVFPDQELIVVLLCNQEFGRWIQTGRDLATLALGGSVDPPAARPSHAIPAADLDRYAGSYESENSAVEVRIEGGHLWLYVLPWPVGKYLAPASDTTFAVPGDIGMVSFADPKASGAASPRFGTLIWNFGDEGTTYSRAP